MAELIVPADLKIVDISKIDRSFKCSGVYLLYHEGVVVYVGQSCNVLCRVGEHLSDRPAKKFDAVAMVACTNQSREWLERLYIEKFKPRYNGNPRADRKPRRRGRRRKAVMARAA